MDKINAFSRRKLSEEEVYIFTAALCDNDIDRDFEKFSLSALNELSRLFVGKTVIADHSMKSSDQRARIFETYVEKQEGKRTLDGEDLYILKGRAYMLRSDENKPLIDEIDAGIKKEGSVSCSMRSHTCSICGKDKRKQRCEHIASKSYNGKLCYSILSDAEDAYEFSFVAVPAQRGAGVTKAFEITEDKNMNEIINTMKNCGEKGVTLSAAQAGELASYISNLEDEARLGDAYKKELSKEVIRLFSQRLPELDNKLFASVTAVMTAEELIGFKKGLEKSAAAPVPQLMPQGEKQDKKDYSQFRI